jgi:hypothetical protein
MLSLEQVTLSAVKATTPIDQDATSARLRALTSPGKAVPIRTAKPSRPRCTKAGVSDWSQVVSRIVT